MWSDTLTIVALTAGTIITLLTLVQKYIWPFIKVVNAAARLVDYELKHNGGFSVKDQLRYIDMNLAKLVEADSLATERANDNAGRISVLEEKFEALAESMSRSDAGLVEKSY